jgi:hypothetical protein
MLRDLFVPCQAVVATESSRLLDNRHGFYLDEETEVYERGDLDHRGCRVRFLEVASELLCRALAGVPVPYGPADGATGSYLCKNPAPLAGDGA